MNEILRSLKSRKSIRAYTDQPVSEEDKDLIINAALQAPTAGNQILYTILDIDDQSVRESLAVSCDNQPFIAEAPVVLIFLADCRRWLDAYRLAGVPARNPGTGDLILACSDALIAAQNAVTAAESLGLGSCYIGDILENCEQHRDLLNLDPFVFPVIMLLIGHPTGQQKARKKPQRFDKEFIVRKNRYSKPSEQELREMFSRLHPEDTFDFNGYLRRFCERKYMSGFALELTRSVEKYLEAFQP